METAAIRYRVADFLKKHQPFHAMDEADLLELAKDGRVKFHEPNEYILWQGESHRLHVFVIQQGTVSLWDEAGELARLCDVRGAGDMLGIERFNGAKHCPYSARSASDVVIYTFPAEDFENLLLKYPNARQYVEAHAGGNVDYLQAGESRDPQNIFLHDLIRGQTPPSCNAQDSIGEAAKLMLAAGSRAIAVVDQEQRARAVLTASGLLSWIAAGGGDTEQPIANLLDGAPPAIAFVGASVADGVLAMSATDNGAVAITSDGTPSGRLHGLITSEDLMPVFGDQPVSILAEIRRADGAEALLELNQRARAFVLQHLTNPGASGWLGRFTSSTEERFAMARSLLPDHESIFREAAGVLQAVLFQQGRIGISQGADGAELPPALLGRYDRQVLKSGFRSILRLIEFTGNWEWIKAL